MVDDPVVKGMNMKHLTSFLLSLSLCFVCVTGTAAYADSYETEMTDDFAPVTIGGSNSDTGYVPSTEPAETHKAPSGSAAAYTPAAAASDHREVYVPSTPSVSYTPNNQVLDEPSTDTGAVTAAVTGKDSVSSDPYDGTAVTSKTLSGELKVKAAVSSNGDIRLTWNSISGAESYVVYYYTDGVYECLKRTSATTYTLKKGKIGRKYSFLIRCVSKGAEQDSPAGKVSVIVCGKPLVKAAFGNGKVTLRWDPVPDAEKYGVYRLYGGKLHKVMTTTKTAVKISTDPRDTGYAVKAVINGKWTSVSMNDIIAKD